MCILMPVIFCADGMWTGNLIGNLCCTLNKTSLSRAWQRKVHSVVQNLEHKAEIYACLCLLIVEPEEHKFREHLQLFMQYWQDQKPAFISYFHDYYSKRVGIFFI